MRVWDLNSAEGGVSCVATLPSIVPSTDQDSNIRATVSWRPNGAAFAVPGKNKGRSYLHNWIRYRIRQSLNAAISDVQLIGRGTWQPIAVLKNGHDEVGTDQTVRLITETLKITWMNRISQLSIGRLMETIWQPLQHLVKCVYGMSLKKKW